ncbi:13790_t:CDS:2 [Entrophospora sp. SA101]|nr:11818_t:CDS:2 [Entrophospora sp. SA101]CAJ0628806.1 13790_t:CDS:2 [Entrophospora sp. SA101]
MPLNILNNTIENSNKNRGALIVLEGCDGSGKSTQAKRLYDHLKNDGVNVKLMRFPDRSTLIGQLINSYLKNEEDLDDTMKNYLLDGTTLIVDRYVFSGVVYSTAKGLDFNWCKSSDIGLLTPDMVIFMNMPSEELLKRKGFGDERYEKLEFQQKVKDNFLKLEDPRFWKILDANKSISEIHNQIMKLSLDTIEQR